MRSSMIRIRTMPLCDEIDLPWSRTVACDHVSWSCDAKMIQRWHGDRDESERMDEEECVMRFWSLADAFSCRVFMAYQCKYNIFRCMWIDVNSCVLFMSGGIDETRREDRRRWFRKRGISTSSDVSCEKEALERKILSFSLFCFLFLWMSWLSWLCDIAGDCNLEVIRRM